MAYFPFPTKSSTKDNYLRLPLPYTAGVVVTGVLAPRCDERGEGIANSFITLTPGELLCPINSVGLKAKPNLYIMCMHPDGYCMVSWANIWLTAGAGLLGGMVFCITGELQFLRIVYKTLIEIEGGTCKDAVTKDTTHLICANETKGKSTKMKAAEKLGKTILTEKEFLALYKKKTGVWEQTHTKK